MDAPGEGGLNADNVEMRVARAGGRRRPACSSPAHRASTRSTRDGQVLAGWPAKIGKLTAELLPIVGEGITGSPVIGPAECAAAPEASRWARSPTPGSATCSAGRRLVPRKRRGRQGPRGRHRAAGGVVQDSPPSRRWAIRPSATSAAGVSFLAPAAGLRRALDAAVNEYQQGSQDFVGAWSTRDGRFRPGFPAVVNDLQFLTGPSVADLDGQAGRGGRGRHRVAGPVRAPRRRPPALPGVAEADRPTGSSPIRSWAASAAIRTRKVVVALTRSGTVLAYRTGAARVLALVLAALPPRRGELGRPAPRRHAARRPDRRAHRRGGRFGSPRPATTCSAAVPRPTSCRPTGRASSACPTRRWAVGRRPRFS